MATADDVKRQVLGRGVGGYVSCNNNPVNEVDPDGRQPVPGTNPLLPGPQDGWYFEPERGRWYCPTTGQYAGTLTSPPRGRCPGQQPAPPRPRPRPVPVPQPPERQVGRSLGAFMVTAYNIANEGDHAATPSVNARGLNHHYSRAFLRDIIMQGSGVDNGGRFIQIDWSHGAPTTPENTRFRYVDSVVGGAGRGIENGVSIAVDPAVIPLGSWVWIDTIGWRRADDTGGRIHGNHIDLFMLVPRRDAVRWGTRHLRVCAEAAAAR
jgi:3D (Asp-Asp-Asp) domain-containing protein